MTNADIFDLRGVYATPLRWNAETGVLGYGAYNEATGEREIIEIELGSSTAAAAGANNCVCQATLHVGVCLVPVAASFVVYAVVV